MVNQKASVERIIDRVEAISQWTRTSGLHPAVVRALLMSIQEIRDDLRDLHHSFDTPAEQPKAVVEEKKNPKPAAKAPVFQK